jgi:prepilin-type processing-associated H-X9-DG protein
LRETAEREVAQMTDVRFSSPSLLPRCARASHHRRGGLTAIELLLVVVVIAVLSSMLFPAFARAREVARGGLCLSNVASIVRAFSMYLADNNGIMPPSETRQDVQDFLDGRGSGWCGVRPHEPNPYLRYPVIMDEYLWTREMWQCPHARIQGGAGLIIAGPDWFGALTSNQAMIGDDLCLRFGVFPPGWGGTVTDSFAQDRAAYATPMERAWADLPSNAAGVFVQSIGVNDLLRDLPVASVADPGNFVICGDAGWWGEAMSPGLLAYPDLCNLECANCGCSAWIEPCIDLIGEGCPELADCFNRYHASSALLTGRTRLGWRTGDRIRSRRSPASATLLSAYTRHTGGTNIGFLDGHAAYWDSSRFLDEWARQARADGTRTAMGLDGWGPYSWCDGGAGPFSTGEEPTLR